MMPFIETYQGTPDLGEETSLVLDILNMKSLSDGRVEILRCGMQLGVINLEFRAQFRISGR